MVFSWRKFDEQNHILYASLGFDVIFQKEYRVNQQQIIIMSHKLTEENIMNVCIASVHLCDFDLFASSYFTLFAT